MPRTAPASRVPRSRRLLVAAAALLLGTTTALAVAGPAVAHDRLVSSDPAAGATVVESPAAVTLTFSADVVADGAFVQVTADGADLGDLPVAVDGETVTATLPADLPNGSYEVSWQVTASDGHGIADVLTFTLAVPVPEAAAGTASSEDAPSEDAAAERAAAEAAAEAEAEQAEQAAADRAAAEDGSPTPITTELPAEDEGGGAGTIPVLWMLGAGLIVLVAWRLARRSGFDPRNGPPGQH